MRRKLYLTYQKSQTVSELLTWSHFIELLKIDDLWQGGSPGYRADEFLSDYYRAEMNTEGDTEPIGIVLGAYQDKLVMQYALQNITNQLFVSRYQLYLPDREQLEAEFRRFMNDGETK